MEFIVDKVEDTLSIGRQIGKLAKKGDIICLTGDLGTGKTHLSKGLAEGLGVTEHITSPTFNIVNEYHSGRLTFYHFDVYRVNDPDEIYAIGFDEYIFGDGISLIEWANYIEELIPSEYLYINIKKIPEKGENFRKITIEPYGKAYEYVKEIKIC
ncbi:MAG: tRNA (adenosine(37)-N6)-threonylcarbamoyltransferase complex ATPase subunit type 1 TsaE [Sarcina sp.]